MVVPLATGVSGNDDYQRASGRRDIPLHGTDSFASLPQDYEEKIDRATAGRGETLFDWLVVQLCYDEHVELKLD
jgi:hypothetical protein